MISRILFNFNFYKKNIWAKNYLSFPSGKSFLKQMLFHSLYKVSIGFGGTFFSENDIGGTWLNGGTKKISEGGGGESAMDDAMVTIFKPCATSKMELFVTKRRQVMAGNCCWLLLHRALSKM